MNRRNFLASIALSTQPNSFATGTRVGEVTHNSAILWARLTTPNLDTKLEGACPPATGRMRITYSTTEDLKSATKTKWVDIPSTADGIHHFQLNKLKPATTYYYQAESPTNTFRGRFQTAPNPNQSTPIHFCVMTCQGFPDRGHVDGHPIYPLMQALNPNFAVLTGDLVYYDNDAPKATSVRLARYHWERMFSLPRLIEFNRNTSTYWLKDDHDTLNNDSWSGQSQGDLTFAQGQQIFLEQAPMSKGPAYRTFRWGKDLQIWFSEGRDNRSPNNMPDGPEKTIWGAEQKQWFKRTVLESDATWKVLVSPTPFVGPDRKNKTDNHSNNTFKHEGDELRQWFAANVPDNFLVICGDRHWQYHSVHPQTQLNEFSVGPASNEHAAGTPGEDKKIHRFHRVQGGFLSAKITGKKIQLDLCDVSGNVSYTWSKTR
jgi:alkaline phosphatase D